MKDHYGYIRGTKGKDKDHIDVFVTKDGHDTSRPVFVVDQVNKDGSFDEHKIVMGAANEKQARRVYKRNYGKDWQGLGAIKQMSQDEFKGWLEGDTTKPVALPVAKKRTTVSEKRTARQDDEVTILSDKRPAPPSLKTSKNIPNRESISATLDDPEEMGVQEFSTKEFAGGARDVFANAKDVQRSRELAEEIRKSGVIDPLIVALDESGEPTILEGAHRLGALAELGVEKFPALVVRERHQDEATEEATTAKPVEPKKPAEDQADMLPAPTTGEQVRKAKTDRKQAQQTSPDMDKGEGDLFSDKSKQKDVEDVAKKPAKTDKLEDFGEVLEGARKHYAQKLKDAESLDVAVEPLSKTWPEPNYQQLLDEGNDPWIVGFIHASRDEIPRKPVKSWKLKRWIEDVEALRNLSHRLLNGEVELDHAQISLENMPRLHEQISGRIDLYQAIGHERSLKGVKFGVSRYSMYNRQKFDPPKEVWEVTKAAKATAFGNMPRVIASGDTKDQAIKQFKKVSGSGALDQSRTKTVRFDIYHKRSDPGTVFIGKKVGRDYVDLETFDSAEAAREYLAKNQDALEKKLAKLKEIPDHRKESNSPRVGADHRNGADVTPEQFTETFGFRGVQFGNYVEGPRRQEDLNETYDALLDLAGILNLPPKSLSLNGELGLAFGARGKGGKRAAKAHFEPDNIVINLTKRKGAGSLAHEWWHSLDNYFARQRGGRSYLTETADQRGEGVRPEMVEAFKNVTQAINRTKLRERSKKLDQTRTEPYWQTGRECRPGPLKVM